MIVTIADFIIENPENVTADKDKRQQNSEYGVQTAASWPCMRFLWILLNKLDL